MLRKKSGLDYNKGFKRIFNTIAAFTIPLIALYAINTYGKVPETKNNKHKKKKRKKKRF